MVIYQIENDKGHERGLFADKKLIGPSLQLWYGPDYKVTDCDGIFFVVNTKDVQDYAIFGVKELIVRETVQTY